MGAKSFTLRRVSGKNEVSVRKKLYCRAVAPPSLPALASAALLVAGTLAPSSALGQGADWEKLPLLQLEGIFKAPLRDTIIQRWRDPANGAVCYLYIPVSQQFSGPAQGSPYVQYGANTIGSISCVMDGRSLQAPANPPPRTAVPAPRHP